LQALVTIAYADAMADVGQSTVA